MGGQHEGLNRNYWAGRGRTNVFEVKQHGAGGNGMGEGGGSSCGSSGQGRR